VKRDAIEALANAAGGFAVSWALTMLIFGTTAPFALGVSSVFFVASVARSWALRALFRRLWPK
jgi:hypothetical protein